ncbi:MAG: hypothetical protein V1721_10220 [Pseudomonadota bacterium]
MLEKMSTRNISELTAAGAFPNRPAPPAPTTEQMIDDIRRDLRLTDKSGVRPDVGKRVQEFEDIVKNVPRGFRLTPVWYSKINIDRNSSVMREFSFHVRADFLKYLATDHAVELAQLGICENGIDRMKTGKDPVDKDGVRYAVAIDHTLPRAGGGPWSKKKEIDPLRPAYDRRLFPVNHFNNLILLPEQVHGFKHTLDELQGVRHMKYRESAWMLMLIPETGPGLSGFVAPPQDPGHLLYGVKKPTQNLSNKIRQTLYMTSRLYKDLKVLRGDKTIFDALVHAGRTAKKRRTTVAGLILSEKNAAPKKDGLGNEFRKAVAHDAERKELLENDMIPAINALTGYLKSAFEEANRPGAEKNAREYHIFRKFFHGQRITHLRAAMETLPLNEAAQACKVFKEIDSALRNGFNRNAEASSENGVNRPRVLWAGSGTREEKTPDKATPSAVVLWAGSGTRRAPAMAQPE